MSLTGEVVSMALLSTIAALSVVAVFPHGAVGGAESFKVLPAVTHGNLAIFPVVREGGYAGTMSGGYITLDEGLKAGTVEVTEKGSASTMRRNRGGGQPQNQHEAPQQRQQSNSRPQQSIQSGGGAQVNELWLINRSGKKLVLLSGEMVVGGQQDRIVQKDMIIPSGKDPVAMNVFCVEQGRWNGQAKFDAPRTGQVVAGAVADPSVRGAAQGRGQQEVWANVAEKNAKSGASGGGTTYQQTLKASKNQVSLPTYQKAIERGFPNRNAVGAVVAVNGHLIWIDRFMDASLFYRYWTKLLASYVIEASTENLGEKVLVRHPSVAEAQRFLDVNEGSRTFEGTERVYKLAKVEGKKTIVHELFDIANGANLMVHFNKMLRK